MQINFAVCDIHESLLLQGKKVTITFRDRTTEEQEDAFPCQDPHCHRYYSPWRGYFRAEVGEFPDFGVPSKKPQCRHNSEPVYMFLMRKDGVLAWACPECTVTQRFTL